jgi:hypothetical protein
MPADDWMCLDEVIDWLEGRGATGCCEDNPCKALTAVETRVLIRKSSQKHSLLTNKRNGCSIGSQHRQRNKSLISTSAAHKLDSTVVLGSNKEL